MFNLSLIISAVVLALACIIINAQLSPQSPSPTQKTIDNLPGVKARITDQGFTYLAGIIGAVFTSHVPMTQVPDIVQTLPGSRGVVRLSNIRLNRFQTTNNYNLRSIAPNRAIFELRQLDISYVL